MLIIKLRDYLAQELGVGFRSAWVDIIPNRMTAQLNRAYISVVGIDTATETS